jgi:hypothetical protein
MKMNLSNSEMLKREKERLFILKFNAMHEVCKMSWRECANVYEEETGVHLTASALRHRARRALQNTKYVTVTELPHKVVVSVHDLTLFGCICCAVRRFFSKIFTYFTNFNKFTNNK